MAEQDNVAVVQKTFDAWNAHDPERWIAITAKDYVVESDTLPAPMRGHDGARAMMAMYLTAFPDLRFEIQQSIASGDVVATRWQATGTHKGDLMGIGPTGRRVITNGCTVSQVKGGTLVRSWIYWDSAHMLRQLGVMPTPAAPSKS